MSSLHEAGVYFIFPSRPVSSSVRLLEWLKTLSPHSTFLSSARSSSCQAVDHACMHISHIYCILKQVSRKASRNKSAEIKYLTQVTTFYWLTVI